MAYLRRTELGTLNGDAGDDDDDDDEEAAEYDAALNRSRTDSRSGGVTAQLVWTRPQPGRTNHAVVGVGFDAAASDFAFSSEYGWLSPSREAIGAGTFDDDAAVGLDAATRTASAFVTDTFGVTSRLHVTGAVRANWTTVVLRDRLGVDLNGDHAFSRVNPSVGATFDVLPALNVYGAWAQSSRVPTAVELTCADPADPCRLPNAFVSDPPLAPAGGRHVGSRRPRRGVAWQLEPLGLRHARDRRCHLREQRHRAWLGSLRERRANEPSGRRGGRRSGVRVA